MQDPLSFTVPTAGVSTKFPLIPEGDYKFQVTESNFGPSNFNKDILAWQPKLVTTEPTTSVDGKSIAPNTQVFLASAFDLSEAPDSKYPGSWITKLCGAYDAIMGTDENTRGDLDKAKLDACVGKLVLGHVVIDEDKKDGTKRNKIKRLKNIAA